MPSSATGSGMALTYPGNLIVAPFGRSLRFPTLRPPSSRTAGGGLRSQVQCTHSTEAEPKANHPRTQKEQPPQNPLPGVQNAPLLPPPAAAHFEPSQVQCTHLPEAIPCKQNIIGGQKEKPLFHRDFSFWNPATSYSPGPSPAKYHRR